MIKHDQLTSLIHSITFHCTFLLIFPRKFPPWTNPSTFTDSTTIFPPLSSPSGHSSPSRYSTSSSSTTPRPLPPIPLPAFCGAAPAGSTASSAPPAPAPAPAAISSSSPAPQASSAPTSRLHCDGAATASWGSTISTITTTRH